MIFELKQDGDEWRVEAVDDEEGQVYVTIFSGPVARERAAAYGAWLTAGWGSPPEVEDFFRRADARARLNAEWTAEGVQE